MNKEMTKVLTNDQKIELIEFIEKDCLDLSDYAKNKLRDYVLGYYSSLDDMVTNGKEVLLLKATIETLQNRIKEMTEIQPLKTTEFTKEEKELRTLTLFEYDDNGNKIKKVYDLILTKDEGNKNRNNLILNWVRQHYTELFYKEYKIERMKKQLRLLCENNGVLIVETNISESQHILNELLVKYISDNKINKKIVISIENNKINVLNTFTVKSVQTIINMDIPIDELEEYFTLFLNMAIDVLLTN